MIPTGFSIQILDTGANARLKKKDIAANCSSLLFFHHLAPEEQR
jgi:hypothetical protein